MAETSCGRQSIKKARLANACVADMFVHDLIVQEQLSLEAF